MVILSDYPAVFGQKFDTENGRAAPVTANNDYATCWSRARECCNPDQRVVLG